MQWHLPRELTWLTYLFRDIKIFFCQPPQLFCDNLSVLHLTINSVFHAQTKHIELDYYFVRKKISVGGLIT